MVLHGQAFTPLPSDLPDVSSSSKIGRSFSFGPAYCSSTCRTAAFKIHLHRIFVPALSFRAFRKPPRTIRAEFVLRFSPFAPGLLVCGGFLLHKRDPFLYGPPGLAFQFRHPLLHHRHARVHSVQRIASRGSCFRHVVTSQLEFLRIGAPIDQRCPNGSSTMAYRSPQNWSPSSIITLQPAATARS